MHELREHERVFVDIWIADPPRCQQWHPNNGRRTEIRIATVKRDTARRVPFPLYSWNSS